MLIRMHTAARLQYLARRTSDTCIRKQSTMTSAQVARRPLSGVVFDMDGTLTMPHAIDFAAMRRRAGVPPGQDTISYIDGIADPEARARAHAAVVEEETLGLKRMQLMPDCADILHFLHDHGIPRALLTRNNDDAMEQTVALLEGRPKAGPGHGSGAHGHGTGGHSHGHGHGQQSQGAEVSVSATVSVTTQAGQPATVSLSSEVTTFRPWPSHERGRPFDLMLSRSFKPCKPHPAPFLHICERWGVEARHCVMVGDHSDDLQCGRAAGAMTVLIGNDTTALPWADHQVATLTELRDLRSQLFGLPVR